MTDDESMSETQSTEAEEVAEADQQIVLFQNVLT